MLYLFALISGAASKNIYVSPTGTGSGSLEGPYGSIQSAIDAAAAGDVIYLRAGTYAPSANIQVGKSGTRTQPITIRPYNTEKVIINGENMPGYSHLYSQSRSDAYKLAALPKP